MSLEFPNIETSQIYTLHFQNRKFYEIKYEKSLGRAEIFCGKLGPSNTKIMARLNALFKEIQGEEQVKNFMTECLKKKLAKGYQFLNPFKVPKSPNKKVKVPVTTSTSILGKRSGQTNNEIEPDIAKKLNSHPNPLQPSPSIISSETFQNIQAPHLSMNGQKSPTIEIESPQNLSSLPTQNIQKASSPIQMVEEIQQSYKTTKITQEKKPPKPKLPKKDNPPQKNLSTQIKEEHKNDKSNLLISPPKVDKPNLFTSSPKNDKPSLFISSPKADKPNLFTSPPKNDKPNLFSPPLKIDIAAISPTFLLNKLPNLNTDKSNPQIPPVKLESGTVHPVLPRGFVNKNSVPPVKNEESGEGTKFFNSNPTAEQRREEFTKKLKKVAPGDCPFGNPSLETHDSLTVPSKWENEDVTGWYMSEKLGGIRCFWNGFEMLQKSGPQCNLPEFFINRLPKSPLDGELIMKGGSLSRCMMIVKKKPTDPDYEKEWNNMSFVVYDAPEAEGKFWERLKALEKYFEKSDGLYINLHEYKKCQGKSHAEEELKKEEKKGGEGILLTNPDGEYVKGKSKHVLERKSKFEGVAKVKEVITEKGRPQIITSLRVENLKGIEFMINRGITNDLIRNPPKVGSEIIYEYKGILDSEKPKAPVYKSMI